MTWPTAQNLIGASLVPSNYWMRTTTGKGIYINLGSPMTIENVWVRFGDTSLLTSPYMVISHNNTPPTDVNTVNCGYITYVKVDGQENWYSTPAASTQYILI